MKTKFKIIQGFLGREILTDVDGGLRREVKKLYEENEQLRNELNLLRNAPENQEFRRQAATSILSGYHSSGRKETVVDFKPMSLEEAAVRSADLLLLELEKPRQ